MVKMSLRVILGTGKTTLTDVLPRKMGFTPVCDALSSAEVNRSYVGQTEQLLKDLLTRAHKLPHLMCMIAVDEIDGLAPKRDDKSSQSKNDALNILLAYVGGAKAVKNLVFMASTNRLKMMDEAFKRRISAQFFVGRPRPDIRALILDKVNVDLLEQGCSVTLTKNNLEDLVVWTTNFSGAALGALVSDLIVFATRALHNRPGMTFTNPMILGIVDKISQQFSLSVGAKSLASIFNEMLLRAGPSAAAADGSDDDEYMDHNNDDEDDCHDNRGARNIMKMQLVRSKLRDKVHELYTGLIVVDLQNGLVIRETKGDHKPHNEHEKHGPRSIDELLTMCVNFATKFELDAVQMFDLDLLLNNAAYDDTKCKEIIQEKIEEMARYPTSLAIIDVDSLVGVNDSESMSSMGGSTNSSASNQAMYNLVGNIINRRNVSQAEEVVEASPNAVDRREPELVTDIRLAHEFMNNARSARADVRRTRYEPLARPSDVDIRPGARRSRWTESNHAEFVVDALHQCIEDYARMPDNVDGRPAGPRNALQTRFTPRECWIVVACMNDHLLKRVLKEKTTKTTTYHQMKDEKEEKEQNEILTCVLCDVQYTRADNEKGLNCMYHDGWCFNPTALTWPREPIHPNRIVSAAVEHAKAKRDLATEQETAQRLLSRGDAKQTAARPPGQTSQPPAEASDELSKFKYLCCFNVCRPKGNGCKKGKHVSAVDEPGALEDLLQKEDRKRGIFELYGQLRLTTGNG
jgi:hypothetical protein